MVPKIKSNHHHKGKKGSDLILAGEITSIDLPSIAWDGDSRATEVKVKLVVRYILKRSKLRENSFRSLQGRVD